MFRGTAQSAAIAGRNGQRRPLRSAMLSSGLLRAPPMPAGTFDSEISVARFANSMRAPGRNKSQLLRARTQALSAAADVSAYSRTGRDSREKTRFKHGVHPLPINPNIHVVLQAVLLVSPHGDH